MMFNPIILQLKRFHANVLVKSQYLQINKIIQIADNISTTKRIINERIEPNFPKMKVYK